MTFRPLPARAPAALLREAKPLKALFNQAQRIDRLQHAPALSTKAFTETAAGTRRVRDLNEDPVQGATSAR